MADNEDRLVRAARKFPDMFEADAFARLADVAVLAGHSIVAIAATQKQALKNLQLERALTPRWRVLRRRRLSHEIRALGGDVPIARSREDAGVKS